MLLFSCLLAFLISPKFNFAASGPRRFVGSARQLPGAIDGEMALALFFFVALALAFWRAPSVANPRFAAPPAPVVSALPIEFASEELPKVAPFSHASTLAELADGRIALAWYAGTTEGSTDADIWFSTRDAEGWSLPKVIATRADTAAATGMVVRKLGNPVLHASGDRLQLWYVTVAVGGWSGASVNHKTSDDGGLTWSGAVKLTTSPLFNMGTLIRTSPVAMRDGGLGLPAYHEMFGQHAEWLRIGPRERVLGKVRIAGAELQPAVAAIDGKEAIMLARSAAKANGVVMANVTSDGGATWQQAAPLPIANDNTSLDLLRLQSGRMLLAANAVRGRDRSVLQLFLSDDKGATWKESRVIADDPDVNAAYSYPALLQTSDGRIHLTYSFHEEVIAHVTTTEAALLEALH
jgi:predicted neuraminidase